MLGTFNLGEITTVETCDDGSFQHGEADVTMVFFVLKAAKSVRDDTDI